MIATTEAEGGSEAIEAFFNGRMPKNIPRCSCQLASQLTNSIQMSTCDLFSLSTANPKQQKIKKEAALRSRGAEVRCCISFCPCKLALLYTSSDKKRPFCSRKASVSVDWDARADLIDRDGEWQSVRERGNLRFGAHEIVIDAGRSCFVADWPEGDGGGGGGGGVRGGGEAGQGGEGQLGVGASEHQQVLQDSSPARPPAGAEDSYRYVCLRKTAC